jgi:transcriptional regulator with XRE-family HTH domain
MNRTLGLRIKRARESLRWSQKRLGDEIGVTQKTIDNWENGRTQPKSAIGALEDVLNIRLDGDDDGTPGLPAIVAGNQHIPAVWAIWSIPEAEMPEPQRLALIRMWLREHGPVPPTRRRKAQ